MYSVNRIKVWVLLSCLSLPSFMFAQREPMKWGKIPRADLEMKTSPQDSNASAVILGDIGEVAFTSYGVVFTRHRRIKILSEAGYKWGDHAIPYYKSVRAPDIDGQTFNLAADGSVQCVKLDKKAVFDEQVSGELHRVRFTLPDLSPGAVVEYRYIVHSFSPFGLAWEFQTHEPTRWSEFRIAIPEGIEYVPVWQSIEGLHVDEFKTYIQLLFDGARSSQVIENTAHGWAMRDVPALREEPFMTTLDDYVAKLRLQLDQIHLWRILELKYAPTWEKLAVMLMTSEGFGRQIAQHGVLRQQAEMLTAGLNTPEEKMRAIYDYVRATMTWNGKYGIFTNENLDKAFQARRGNGSEIALTLTSMLRFAGLEAHPVLISTRDNGKLVQLYPLLDQFNHVLTYVKVGDREYWLDATDSFRPHDLLPVAALNEIGWLVDKKNPRWINIPNSGSFINQTSVFAELSADGTISGRLVSNDGGYNGLFDRRTLRDKKAEEHIRDKWLNDLAGARLDSFKISYRDSTHRPLVTEAHFFASEHAQVAEDKIYFNPILVGRSKENPFKRPERTLPVDFAYGHTLTYTLLLTLPEGYLVEELPKNIIISLPNNGGQFRRLAQIEGNHLQVISQMVIRQIHFEPIEYKALREFYDRIVAAHAEPVVLKRGAMTSTVGKP